MKPIVYDNIQQLTYRELIEAISNIKEKLNKNIEIPDNSYYLALVDELDKRTKEQ